MRATTLLSLLLLTGAAQAQMSVPGLDAAHLAIVVNDEEANSVAIGELYRKARDVPARNVVHVRIPGKPHKLTAEQFARLKEEIDSKLPHDIEAVLMVWTAPWAVECNSITSAYTLGFDPEQCVKTCSAGRPSAYFNSPAPRPSAAGAGLRLSMLMPTESVADAKALIGRGVASGFRLTPATAYYLVTGDKARNSRAPFFPRSTTVPPKKLAIRTLQQEVLEGAQDVLVYQTGRANVDKLDTLKFVPGALADHLTSWGGNLLGTEQMSSLRWLEAGATASYGTVSEPCNHWQKFPNPSVLLRHYVNGATAIEAYWKSVAWPAQGVFIGEPLAAPYRRAGGK